MKRTEPKSFLKLSIEKFTKVYQWFLSKIKHPVIVVMWLCVLSLMVGFISGMEYKIYQIKTAVTKIAYNVAQQERTYVNRLRELDLKTQDEFELPTFKVRINSVATKSIITGLSQNVMVPSENAKFVLVNVSITNIRKTPQVFWDKFRLVDQKGREFDYLEESFSVQNHVYMSKVEPGFSYTGVMVFEVPMDAETYYLKFNSQELNTSYKVTL